MVRTKKVPKALQNLNYKIKRDKDYLLSMQKRFGNRLQTYLKQSQQQSQVQEQSDALKNFYLEMRDSKSPLSPSDTELIKGLDSSFFKELSIQEINNKIQPVIAKQDTLANGKPKFELLTENTTAGKVIKLKENFKQGEKKTKAGIEPLYNSHIKYQFKVNNKGMLEEFRENELNRRRDWVSSGIVRNVKYDMGIPSSEIQTHWSDGYVSGNTRINHKTGQKQYQKESYTIKSFDKKDKPKEKMYIKGKDGVTRSISSNTTDEQLKDLKDKGYKVIKSDYDLFWFNKLSTKDQMKFLKKRGQIPVYQIGKNKYPSTNPEWIDNKIISEIMKINQSSKLLYNNVKNTNELPSQETIKKHNEKVLESGLPYDTDEYGILNINLDKEGQDLGEFGRVHKTKDGKVIHRKIYGQDTLLTLPEEDKNKFITMQDAINEYEAKLIMDNIKNKDKPLDQSLNRFTQNVVLPILSKAGEWSDMLIDFITPIDKNEKPIIELQDTQDYFNETDGTKYLDNFQKFMYNQQAKLDNEALNNNNLSISQRITYPVIKLGDIASSAVIKPIIALSKLESKYHELTGRTLNNETKAKVEALNQDMKNTQIMLGAMGNYYYNKFIDTTKRNPVKGITNIATELGEDILLGKVVDNMITESYSQWNKRGSVVLEIDDYMEELSKNAKNKLSGGSMDDLVKKMEKSRQLGNIEKLTPNEINVIKNTISKLGINQYSPSVIHTKLLLNNLNNIMIDFNKKVKPVINKINDLKLKGKISFQEFNKISSVIGRIPYHYTAKYLEPIINGLKTNVLKGKLSIQEFKRLMDIYRKVPLNFLDRKLSGFGYKLKTLKLKGRLFGDDLARQAALVSKIPIQPLYNYVDSIAKNLKTAYLKGKLDYNSYLKELNLLRKYPIQYIENIGNPIKNRLKDIKLISKLKYMDYMKEIGYLTKYPVQLSYNKLSDYSKFIKEFTKLTPIDKQILLSNKIRFQEFVNKVSNKGKSITQPTFNKYSEVKNYLKEFTKLTPLDKQIIFRNKLRFREFVDTTSSLGKKGVQPLFNKYSDIKKYLKEFTKLTPVDKQILLSNKLRLQEFLNTINKKTLKNVQPLFNLYSHIDKEVRFLKLRYGIGSQEALRLLSLYSKKPLNKIYNKIHPFVSRVKDGTIDFGKHIEYFSPVGIRRIDKYSIKSKTPVWLLAKGDEAKEIKDLLGKGKYRGLHGTLNTGLAKERKVLEGAREKFKGKTSRLEDPVLFGSDKVDYHWIDTGDNDYSLSFSFKPFDFKKPNIIEYYADDFQRVPKDIIAKSNNLKNMDVVEDYWDSLKGQSKLSTTVRRELGHTHEFEHGVPAGTRFIPIDDLDNPLQVIRHQKYGINVEGKFVPIRRFRLAKETDSLVDLKKSLSIDDINKIVKSSYGKKTLHPSYGSLGKNIYKSSYSKDYKDYPKSYDYNKYNYQVANYKYDYPKYNKYRTYNPKYPYQAYSKYADYNKYTNYYPSNYYTGYSKYSKYTPYSPYTPYTPYYKYDKYTPVHTPHIFPDPKQELLKSEKGIGVLTRTYDQKGHFEDKLEDVGISLKDAVGIGQEIVDETPASSFKLVRVNKPGRTFNGINRMHKFTQKNGKFYEKQRYREDRNAEKAHFGLKRINYGAS